MDARTLHRKVVQFHRTKESKIISESVQIQKAHAFYFYTILPPKINIGILNRSLTSLF